MKIQSEKPDLLEVLTTNTVEYFKWYPPNDPKHDAIMDNFGVIFPFSWGRILTDKVNFKVQEVGGADCSHADMIELISAQLRNYDRDSMVYVMWSNMITGIMEVHTSTVLKYLKIIYDQDFDFWVFDVNYGWCIECYHSGSIIFFT